MEWKKLARPKLLLGLAVVLVAVWLFAPNTLAGLGSLAIVAACPLAMVAMMIAMGGMGGRKERIEGAAGEAEVRERELAQLRAEAEALRRDRTARPKPVRDQDSGGTRPTPLR